MSKIKNCRLDQYGAGPLELQQFGTVGVKGVNYASKVSVLYLQLHHASDDILNSIFNSNKLRPVKREADK